MSKDNMPETVQPFVAILFVLALLGALLHFLRIRGVAAFRKTALPFGRHAVSRQLRVIEGLSLDPQHSLYLVRAGNRHLLMATAPGGCQLVEAAQITEDISL